MTLKQICSLIDNVLFSDLNCRGLTLKAEIETGLHNNMIVHGDKLVQILVYYVILMLRQQADLLNDTVLLCFYKEKHNVLAIDLLVKVSGQGLCAPIELNTPGLQIVLNRNMSKFNGVSSIEFADSGMLKISLLLEGCINERPLDYKVKVLVVDDDPGCSIALKIFLEEHGLHVTTFDSLNEARVDVQENEYQAIFLDLNVNGENSVSLAKLIKSTKHNSGSLLILMTATDHRFLGDILVGGEFNYLVEKPYDPSRILSLLSDI